MIDADTQPSQPFMTMIAGPNGAGKTTLTNRYRQIGYEFGTYINADDIAQGLVGTYDCRVREAQEIADRARALCVREMKSFSFETVMSHPSKIELLERACNSGFFIQLFFIGIDDPRIGIDRVVYRVSKGGHDVPEDRIIARWQRTMNLLSSAILLSDSALIFDNSSEKGIRPLIQWKKTDSQLQMVSEAAQTPPWMEKYVLQKLPFS